MHWEWRGFGAVSEAFLERYEALPLARDWQEVTDTYFCLAAADLNLKLRDGAEDGLKLKRRLRRTGELELWTERLEDIRLFPMRFDELESLAREAGLALPATNAKVLQRDRVLDLLGRAAPRPRIVTVEKVRETHRLWDGDVGVLVELVDITAPRRTRSLSVQNALDLEDASPEAIRTAEDLVRRAVESLGVRSEGLLCGSYVDVVRTWE